MPSATCLTSLSLALSLHASCSVRLAFLLRLVRPILDLTRRVRWLKKTSVARPAGTTSQPSCRRCRRGCLLPLPAALPRVPPRACRLPAAALPRLAGYLAGGRR
eukprot:4874510-Heterocapsa_arctica.AAC.1